MSHVGTVDLGFAEPCEPHLLESYHFPSKIGGKPAWLDLKNLPKHEELQCEVCKQSMIFLCQVYAPYEEDSGNFHRTIFVFICRNIECCRRNCSDNIKVFRNSLCRENQFYSYEPVEGILEDFKSDAWVKLCTLCGVPSSKHCSKCKLAVYCSREHQVIDWKEGHKNECESKQLIQRSSKLLFPQFELVIEAEEVTQKNIDEAAEIAKFEQLQSENKTGTMQDVTEDEIESHAAKEADKVFAKFKQRIELNPEQVLRYERGGTPLWIAADPKPDGCIPDCGLCGSKRQFEFQIMPQMLSICKENELDWGVIVVYTCEKSCTLNEGYKAEFVFKQDVTDTNIG